MKTLRTPDERFSDRPDFPYEPKYVEVDFTQEDAGEELAARSVEFFRANKV